MLQDMVVAAVNEAIRAGQELAGRKLGGRRAAGFDPMSALDAPRRARRPRRRRRDAGGCPAAAARNRAARRSAEVALLAPPLQRLVTELGKLPGHRQPHRPAAGLPRAARLAPRTRTRSRDAIRDVKEKITLCEICFNLAEGPRCTICLDERRDAGLICVVEEPGDVIPIERTHEYRGRYHVLGGALSPIDGVEPEDLKIAQLYARVARRRARGPRGRPRHQPDDDRRGDRPAHRRRPARARAGGRGDAPRLRPAGRRRPRVRRRGHPRPRVLGPPGAEPAAARRSARASAASARRAWRRATAARRRAPRCPRRAAARCAARAIPA